MNEFFLKFIIRFMEYRLQTNGVPSGNNGQECATNKNTGPGDKITYTIKNATIVKDRLRPQLHTVLKL